MDLKKIKWAAGILSAAMLFACSDGDDFDELGRPQDVYDMAVLSVKDDFPPELKISSVQLVLLDDKGDSLNILDMDKRDSLNRNYNSHDQYFTSSKIAFLSSWVKLLVHTYSARDSIEMDFAHYYDISDGFTVYLDLKDFLIEKRVKALMDQGVSTAGAIKEASVELNDETRSFWSYNNLFFKHFISDSAYCSNLEQFRDDFATDELDVAQMELETADELYDRFDGFAWTNGYEGSAFYASELLRHAYSIGVCSETNFMSRDSINVPSSRHNGVQLVCDIHERVLGYLAGWRELSEFELATKPCLYGKPDSVTYKEKFYICSGESIHEWVLDNDTLRKEYQMLRDSIGVCDETRYKALRFYKDSLYICTTDRSKYGYHWSKDANDISSVYSNVEKSFAYLNACLIDTLGECTPELENQNFNACGAVMACRNGAWMEPTNLQVLLGICDSISLDTVVRKVDEKSISYYACHDYDSGLSLDKYKGCGWRKTDMWEYYKDTCNAAHNLDVVYRDSVYYVCKDTVFDTLAVKYAVQPTFEKKTCNYDLKNQFLKYDSLYYMCDGTGWRLPTETELTAPILEGYVCNYANRDSVVKLDDQYYKCSSSNVWKKMSQWDSDYYEWAKEHAGYCSNGIKGTTILWSEKLNRIYGCKYSVFHDSVEFTSLNFSGFGNYSALEGGAFADDTTYRVVDGNLTFEFWLQDLEVSSKSLYARKVYVGEASDANYKYDFHVDSNAVLLMPKHGSSKVKLDTLTDVSESFTDFFAAWKADIVASLDTGTGYKYEVYAWNYGEDSYKDYETAKSFCPAGYHIPDTTEWLGVAKWNLESNYFRVRDDALVDYRMFTQCEDGICTHTGGYMRDIMWSSTAKDDKTQYCYEVSKSNVYTTHATHRIIECPKDLRPMVQTMCIKDRID